MNSLSEEVECRFYDATQDIASSEVSHSDRIELLDSNCVPDDAVEGIVNYDIWLHSPRSTKERRSKFLSWMGVDLNKNVEEISEVDRVSKKSEAVLRTLGFEDGFYSSRSSMSCWSDRNSDFSEDFSLRENSACRDGNSNGARYGVDDVGNQEESERTSVPNNSVETTKRIKKSWLSILCSFSCVTNRQAEADEIRTDDENDDDVSWGHTAQRVKVRPCRKQQKELSALFKEQDIQAHAGSILTMKFSPNGQFLASAGEDGVVRLWQVMEDERLNEQEIDPSCIYFTVNHLSELKPLSMDKDKLNKLRRLRKTSDSACVILPPKVFRILEKPLHEFHGHNGEILDLSWSNNNSLLSCSVDKTVRLWRLGFNDCVGVFPHSNYVTCVQFNPVNDNYFISGSIDGKVRIWEVLGCQVVDWSDITDIVTAACYRPDGKGGIIGSISGTCHFFNMSDHHLQLGAKICLHNKKKSPCKRITGFKFFPHDSSKVMVTCADSLVRILHGLDVVGKYKGVRNAGSQISACFTSDGKHIVSACEDSNVYIWNCDGEGEQIHPQAKTIRSCERFSTNASVAISWPGMKPENGQHFHVSDDNTLDKLPFSSPTDFSLKQEYVFESFPRGSATWPEEKLPPSSPMSSAMPKLHYKFLKTSCQSTRSSHVWGLIIVTAGWDGRIRSFHNYGLPVPV